MKTNLLARLIVLGAMIVALTLHYSPLNSQTPAEEPSAPAAEGATPDGAPAPAADPAASVSAGFTWANVNWESWIIIGLGVLVLAVAIDRIYVITIRNKGDNEKLVQLLTERLIKDPQNLDEITNEVNQPKFGLEGRVAAIALKGWPHGVDTIHQYAQTALAAERRNLERRLIVLNTLGNNIPFIGLLGTVLGIMQAFGDLATSGGDAGPAVVMLGISKALIATALGLIVAVPTVIFYNGLSKAAKTRISMAEEIVSLMQAIRLSRSNGAGAVAHKEGSVLHGR